MPSRRLHIDEAGPHVAMSGTSVPNYLWDISLQTLGGVWRPYPASALRDFASWDIHIYIYPAAVNISVFVAGTSRIRVLGHPRPR